MTKGETHNRNEYMKEVHERELDEAAQRLAYLLQLNEERSPETKVHVSTYIGVGDGGFVAVCGSAHRMEDAFVNLFKGRPEFRQVVQNALDRMYKVDMK